MSEPPARYVGFSTFLTKIKVFGNTEPIKLIKTLVIPHEAFESFEWTFFDDFDALKLHLHRQQAKAVKVSGSHFWKKSVYHGITLEGKNIFFNSRHLRVSN